MKDSNKTIKKEIMEVLEAYPRGLTITETSNRSALNYMTVSKYLAILQAENKVDYVQIGMAKLFKLK